MEYSENAFKGGYSHLCFEDDVITEVQQPEEVTTCQVSSGPSWGHNRRLPVCLGLLSLALLLIDIGLGIHYGLLPNYSNITHMSSELTILRGKYEAAVQTRGETRRRVGSETTEEVRSKQVFDHHWKRTKEYKNRIAFLQQEKIELQSKLILSEESCRRCLTGWTLLISRCYYFAFSNTPKPWDAARESCAKKGGDLVVIDSAAKQMAISKIINDDQLDSRAGEWLGFWLGLRDDQGGTWQWHGGTPLATGFWMPGEPSEHLTGEHCAATYARDALQNWNNAECQEPNKWICEMSMKH